MKKKIYYVNGVATSGKDAFLDRVETYIDITRVSTVDKVKELATTHFGWNGIKDERGRALLASLRYAWGKYNDGPINSIKESIEADETGTIFIMVREFKEMMKMQKLFGGETIKVIRPDIKVCSVEQGFLNEVPGDYKYNYVIDNAEDMDHLGDLASEFVHNTILGQII